MVDFHSTGKGEIARRVHEQMEDSVSKTYGPNEVIEVLEQIVAEYGPETTRACYYKQTADYEPETDGDPGNGLLGDPGDQPHCIAGVFVHKLGGPEALFELAEHEAITDVSYGNGAVLAGLGVTLDGAAVLGQAQQFQDSGYDWGTAIESVKARLAERKL